MSIKVGEVISVQGVRITLRIDESSSKETIFYNGKRYKGLSIREYVLIQRGFKDIICFIEGEYLDESRQEQNIGKPETIYIRKVDARPIGYFQNQKFYEGIKFLPMIKDSAFLVSEKQILEMYGNPSKKDGFVIGTMLKEELPVSLPWKKIFNTHIGIFGNTGSGKSNTLAKLYTTLFNLKKESLKGKSKFIIIDFNGEYTNDQLTDNLEDKMVYHLNTFGEKGDKFPIEKNKLWNSEILSILFKATENTQTPFLSRVVRGWKNHHQENNSLENYIKYIFKTSFTSAIQTKEILELLRDIAKLIGNKNIINKLSCVICNITTKNFYIKNSGNSSDYFDSEIKFTNYFSEVDYSLSNINPFDELRIRINIQLIRDLISGYVQFEHIQPLLKRIEDSSKTLSSVIDVTSTAQENAAKLLTIISLRECNHEVKKIIPLLLTKHFYEQHKEIIKSGVKVTIHLIIDEAHNILSQQSTREKEVWKDYRLELFEEIIKEGRKFGVFLTLSSQRPADISPTIMSQIHNFFIHRLVNDKDLFLLDNTISTLDLLSKSMIPNLGKGCCIVTGTSFNLPLVMQIECLDKKFQPDSEDIDLEELWK